MFGFNSSKKRPEVELTVSNRTVVRVLILVLLSLVGLAAIQKAAPALILLFTAVFLALALNAPVHWLAERLPGKRKGSRSIATALSFMVIILFFVGFVASIVPPLIKQTGNFIDAAPRLIDDVRSSDGQLGKIITKYHLQDDIDKFSSELSTRMEGAASAAYSTAGKVTGSVFATLTVLVLTFMMLVEGPRWIRLMERFVPEHHHPRLERLAADMYKVIKGYVNGQVILAAIAALMLLPALIILDIDYPAALVVIVFICGLIPMVGHTIGAIIVTIVALFSSPLSAIIILAYYFLYQQIENYLIQPRIQANSTNMSPLLVFASVIIGVNFNGLLGGLVAIPIAGCIRILMIDYMKNHRLIDSAEKEALVKHPQTANID
jgi:predicted PurR-regulated permease PerM